jgi:hypothetical protein
MKKWNCVSIFVIDINLIYIQRPTRCYGARSARVPPRASFKVQPINLTDRRESAMMMEPKEQLLTPDLPVGIIQSKTDQ